MFPLYFCLNCVALECNLSPVAKSIPQIEIDCKLVFDWKDLEVKKPYVFYFPFRLNANILLIDIFLFSPNKEVKKMKEKDFASAVANAGGRAFIVGGFVRDEIMGVSSHDKDLMVTGLSNDQFTTLFPDAKMTGKDFPVFRMEVGGEEMEIALARKERKTAVGHNGFTMLADGTVSVEEDLVRRDTTMNAIAKDVLSGEVIDPFGGIADIHAGVIRHVSDAFREDALRVLRVARQAAKFGFEVAPETVAMCNSCKEELATISAERVRGEMLKALETEHPSIFFRTLVACDCLDVVFAEIDALRGQTQPIEHHPEGDAFEHTMQVLDRASSLTIDVMVRFAALCHDIGKGVTPVELLPKHHGHDAKGAEIISSFASGRFLAAHKDAAEVASRFHMKARTEMGAKPMLAMLESLKKSKLGIDGLRIVVAADSPKDDVALLPCFNEAVIHAALDKVTVPAEMRGKKGEAIRQFVHKTKLARVTAALTSLS